MLVTTQHRRPPLTQAAGNPSTAFQEMICHFRKTFSTLLVLFLLLKPSLLMYVVFLFAVILYLSHVLLFCCSVTDITPAL